MSAEHAAIAGFLLVVVVLFLVLRVLAKGGILPPHEFAYGAPLSNCAAIPQQMNQFLSLEGMDPNQIQIETFVGNQSEKNLAPLIAYILLRVETAIKLISNGKVEGRQLS